jgi:predicted phosphodiesterase
MSKSVKFLAFGCPHAPLHDKAHIAWVCEQSKQHKPDFVFCLGDLFEADSASRWPSEYEWDLTEEYRAANVDVLQEIRKASPKSAKFILTPGNHDANLLEINRLPSKVRGTCDWRRKQYDDEGNWLNEELLTHWHHQTKYEYDRVTGVYRLGQVTFAHGYECNQSADEMHSLLLGVPNGLYIGTHTHRPLAVTQAKRTMAIPLPYWYCNTGCSRDMHCGFMKRKRQHQWGQGCVIGSCDPTPLRSTMSTVRNWDAETLVRKMYGDK